MTTRLCWRSVPEGSALGPALKSIIAREVFNQDGSCGSEWVSVRRPYIPFCEGVMAATDSDDIRKEAQVLRDLIRQYDVIQLRLTR
jgi:hypothetical protein